MFSLLKRLSTWPTLLGALAVFGPLTLLFLLKVPDKLARAVGYTGEQTVFAFDAHPYRYFVDSGIRLILNPSKAVI